MVVILTVMVLKKSHNCQQRMTHSIQHTHVDFDCTFLFPESSHPMSPALRWLSGKEPDSSIVSLETTEVPVSLTIAEIRKIVKIISTDKENN